ncbi:alpha-2-macroglobulin family protein [Pedobacter arcticus]|uniref:alpha-2-macroglobulin family protein n=1 Tax=Pedobacter arcticus TaxID=752140 RepID=UPI000305C1CF|nr:MG2 domain-containing protein [Pedobacter arcticus]
MKKLYILLFFFYCASKPVFAQTNFNDVFYSIDSLESIGQPQAALAKVEKLQALAKKEANETLFLKCTVYKIKFISYLQEDAIAKIISSLNQEIKVAAFPTRNILQSFEAEIYNKYYNQNRYKISQRSDLAIQNTDFTFWGTIKLLEETGYLYQASLNNLKELQRIPIGNYDAVLIGDQTTRKYRPTLYDLLLNRALDYYLSYNATINQPKPLFLLFNPDLFKPTIGFIQINLTDEQANHNYLKGLKLIQQATAFHLANHNEEAVADLELRKLDFIYKNTNIYNKDSLYIKRLGELAGQTKLNGIASEATAKLAQYYYNKAEKIKAFDYYQQLKELTLDSAYTIIAKNGIKAIEEVKADLTFEEINTPDQAVLGLVNHKNAKKLVLEIYKINDNEIGALKTNNFNFVTQHADSVFIKLRNKQVYRIDTLNLSEFTDYQNHIYEFKLDALPTGDYYILNEYSSSQEKHSTTYLKVSNISIISSTQNKYNKNTFIVQERQSGKPIKNAEIAALGYSRLTKKMEKVVNAVAEVNDGLFVITPKVVDRYDYLDLKIIYKKDTLNQERISFNKRNYKTQLVADKNSSVVYTDRAIYRPGQTVYFKGICFDKRAEKAKLASNSVVEFHAKSQDGTKLADMKSITNEFGSFEGSFVIPQQVLNGRIRFEVNDNDAGSVLLEEYKRPNFEVSLIPEKQTYNLNDSVTFKGKVLAYNGYALPNAKVAYVLNRSLNYIPNFEQSNFGQQLLKAATVLTDGNGEFKVSFLASHFVRVPIEKQLINYSLAVTVTDENGETQIKSAHTRVKKNNIFIYAEIPSKVTKIDAKPFKISLKNLSFHPVNGNIEASLSKLEPKKLYSKTRLFKKVDSSFISLKDYQKHFPDVAPIGDTEKSSNSIRIESLTMNGDSSAFTLKFDKISNLETGDYQIEIKAKSVDGDTVSRVFDFYYIHKPAIAQKINNWLTVDRTQILQTEKATFSINMPQVYVLMEVFDEEKKIQSQWIKTGKQPRLITLGLGDKPLLNISFLMVYKNRVLTFNQSLTLKQKQEKLNYQFLNFQSKLEPGQKDKISLRITTQNGQPADAEVVATMYDASLDAVYSSQNWQTLFKNKSGSRFSYFNSVWNIYSFNRSVQSSTRSESYFSPYFSPKFYESIDFGNYNYVGNYNSAFREYKNRVKQISVNTYQDSLIKVQYLQNAKAVKTGFDYNGRVVDYQTGLGVPGAIIRLKDKNISTVSNSFGYFKIKVPENSKISIEYADQKLVEITCKSDTNYPIITINRSVDKGIKTIKGNPNMEIMIRGTNVLSSGDVQINTSLGEGPINGLNEVVVVGYGTQKRSDLTGAVAGVQAEAVNQIFTSADDLVGKTMRTNFAETALFIPQLKADERGVFTMPFTLPDALTKWHFKAFAYDKELNSIAIDTQLVAQKSLMVQSNMPRFFRTGDTVNVKLRVINLTIDSLKANLRVEFYNLLNNKVLNVLINSPENQFNISPNSNAMAELSLAIPEGVEAIGYRFIVDAGKFSDGEQNSAPVLSNSILLTQSMSMLVKEGESKTFIFEDFVKNNSKTLQHKSLTFEWTANPNWLVAEAIPYLAEPRYEGSEPIFSALYANAIATRILDKNPGIKNYFAKFKDSSNNASITQLAKNPELKSILLQESPWLKNAASEKEQQRKLALFFQMDSIQKQQSIYSNKLKQLQLANGAFPWMSGTYEDQFISQYILAGLGQLKGFGALTTDKTQEEVTQKLLVYVKSKIEGKDNVYLDAHAWYAISYFEKTVPTDLNVKWQAYVKDIKAHWLSFSLYQQTLAAFTLSRLGEKELSKTISSSIKDRAIKTKDMGAYWPSVNWGCFWYQLPIETHALVIEMLEETEPTSTLLPELKLWLLRQKQTNNWGTSKATTLACYALLKQSNVLENNRIPEIKLGGKSVFELKPALKAEDQTGYIKTNWLKDDIRPDFGKVEITNAPQTAFGAMYWQYTENQDKVKPGANGLKLIRKYYLKNQQNSTYMEIDANYLAKIGDLIKVIVTLKSDRDYEYVLLKDMRPSATEPTQQISRYNAQDGLFYYQVSKDVSTNFFINYLRKGNYVFEYELRVAQSGKFSTGISTIESMYAPEYRSNSAGKFLSFGK